MHCVILCHQRSGDAAARHWLRTHGGRNRAGASGSPNRLLPWQGWSSGPMTACRGPRLTGNSWTRPPPVARSAGRRVPPILTAGRRPELPLGTRRRDRGPSVYLRRTWRVARRSAQVTTRGQYAPHLPSPSHAARVADRLNAPLNRHAPVSARSGSARFGASRSAAAVAARRRARRPAITHQRIKSRLFRVRPLPDNATRCRFIRDSAILLPPGTGHC